MLFGSFGEITASEGLVLWMWHENCSEVLQPGLVIFRLIDLDEAEFLIDILMDEAMCLVDSS